MVKVYVGLKLEVLNNLENKNRTSIAYKKNLLAGHCKYKGILVAKLASLRVLDYTNILLTLSWVIGLRYGTACKGLVLVLVNTQELDTCFILTSKKKSSV